MFKSKRIRAGLLGALVVTAGVSLVVGEASAVSAKDWKLISIDHPGALRWGKQTRTLRIKNISDDYKFLAAVSRTLSSERTHARLRNYQSNFIIFPGEDTVIEYTIDVPENFSPVRVIVSLYDVVDTADDLSWGAKILDTSFDSPVQYPESALAYRDSLPRVGGAFRYHPVLGTDLSLLVNVLFGEGLKTEEIAKITGLEPRQVNRIASDQRRYHLIEVRKGAISSEMTFIRGLDYDTLDKMIELQAEMFASDIEKALPRFYAVRDSLVKVGVATPDSNDTVHGTVMLYHLYPYIGGVVLWESLARKFLNTDSVPPVLLVPNYPCNQDAPEYDYLLVDDEAPDPVQVYFLDRGRKRHIFGIDVPPLDCNSTRDRHGRGYGFPDGARPKFYVHNPELSAPALSVFVDALSGDEESFENGYLLNIESAGVEDDPAIRAWVWKQLVERVLDELSRRGVMENNKGTYFQWTGSIH